MLAKEIEAKGFHQAGVLFSGPVPRNKSDVLRIRGFGVKRILAFFPWNKKLISFAKSKGIEYVNANVKEHEVFFFEQALLADAKKERCFVNCIAGGTSSHYIDEFALAKRGRFDVLTYGLNLTHFRKALAKVRRQNPSSKQFLDYLKARGLAITKRRAELERIARKKSSYPMIALRRRW